MSLLELNIGKEVIIIHLDLEKETKIRYNGLGIIKGSKIKTIRKGIGINIYEIKGAHIALRNEDTTKIFI